MSVLAGRLEVGDLVTVTYYSPTKPHWHSTLSERIELGEVYRRYTDVRLTFVEPIEFCSMVCQEAGICPHAGTGQRFAFRIPGDRGQYPYSSGDETWALVEHVAEDGALW